MVDFQKMQSDITSQGEMIREMFRLFMEEKKPVQVDDNKPMNIEQASEFLGVPVSTIYNKKSIPHYKKGKRLFFFKSELIQYAKGVHNQNPDEKHVQQRKAIKKN